MYAHGLAKYSVCKNSDSCMYVCKYFLLTFMWKLFTHRLMAIAMLTSFPWQPSPGYQDFWLTYVFDQGVFMYPCVCVCVFVCVHASACACVCMHIKNVCVFMCLYGILMYVLMYVCVTIRWCVPCCHFKSNTLCIIIQVR